MKCDRSVVFLSGRDFLRLKSGLGQRSRLVFRYLSEAVDAPAKVLISPGASGAKNQGWETYDFFPQENGRFQFRGPSRSWRLLRMLRIRFRSRLGHEEYAMLGASCVPDLKEIRRILGRHQNALVIVYRCDWAPVVAIRSTGERWILDANDSLANLVSRYDCMPNYRRLVGLPRETLVSRVAESELKYASLFDRVVGISKEDTRFYSRTTHAITNDSCFVSEDFDPSLRERVYDIGMIGGAHLGAKQTAEQLVAIAERLGGGYRVAIAGRVCSLLAASCLPSNVCLVGEVASANEFLSSCRYVLLYSGGETGTSVKFQEAVLSGATVIANESAARWEAAIAGRDFIRVESLDEVERAIENRVTTDASSARTAAAKQNVWRGLTSSLISE